MADNSEVLARTPHAQRATAHVAILMCTKDGGAFLGEQLDSIMRQTHGNWRLIVSDDGSRDATLSILSRFAEGRAQEVAVRGGPRQGVCANFLSLASDPSIAADYFAFSDQDDIWYDDKLERALTWLGTVPNDVPAVYCGRTELVSNDGRTYGLSPLFARPISFRNAIVQSLGGGNTMVFNAAAKRLLETTGRLDVVLHDWWLYQLVSAVGGAVHYDPQPMLKYRQHPDNLIGSNHGWAARLVRLRMIFQGRFRDWNAKNIAALERIPAHLITPPNRAALALFVKLRAASLFKRLYYLRQSGIYRQTVFGNIGLIVATIVKRI
ncbi:MAG TPA: glycosyltransferase family 2 protein [Pseudolabrys sp.]|nr:glycosyltransferase family 2 protein [Pseudolabrys sp.]